MTQIKTYILQKDLPDVKAGAKFEIGASNDGYYLTSDKTGTKYNSYWYPIFFVENNPEWFLPEEEPMYTKSDYINGLKDAFNAGRETFGKSDYRYNNADYYILTLNL